MKIIEEELNGLGFFIIGKFRRYDSYMNNVSIKIDVYRYKIGGEYISHLYLPNYEKILIIKSFKKLKEILNA